MATFDTPDPVSVTLDLAVAAGDVRIVAAERVDTVVDLRPADPDSRADVKAAEQALILRTADNIVVRATKPWYGDYTPFGRGAITVRIDLPAGSAVRGEAALGGFVAEGRLGECVLKTHRGDIRLGETGPVRLTAGSGEVRVDRVAGPARVTLGHGSVRLGEILGPTTVKSSHGDVRLDHAWGAVRVRGAAGDLRVGTARGDVDVKTARGDIRLDEVGRGTVVAITASGEVEVGVRPGVATWLEAHTRVGRVRSALRPSGPPAPGTDRVRVQARSFAGDIVIHPARPPARPVSDEAADRAGGNDGGRPSDGGR
ncbi:DUF4097 family beta strand repeat-containing protein [Actinokineospora enzanensis]|uniref:DUF4097 family beta strand repeat-containing protein n=1 Tax=Actinokineospora enzanensis TaxID=155975 RepID=UPI000380A06D|nr:DUF4097 family beta strand repeat-containing protein [Actinokineospora enzanensis]